MSSKIALVTGGTSGVGLSLVKALAKQKYQVYFVGTDLQKGKTLETELHKVYSTKVHFIAQDLGALNEVHTLASGLCARLSHIDVLVNAAGVLLPQRQTTVEGLEKTFAVSYLSAFVLIKALLPLLHAAPQARILNVGASASLILKTRVDFNNLDGLVCYNGFKASTQAVHAKAVLTSLWAERLSETSIDVNSFDPGMVRSSLTRHMAPPLRLLARIFYPFMAAESKTGIYAATSENVAGLKGRLFVGDKVQNLVFEEAYKQQLWTASEALWDMVSNKAINK